MKIEAGKFYRLSNGERVGPMVGLMFQHWVLGEDNAEKFPREWNTEGKGGWFDVGEGVVYDGRTPDIVAEWTDQIFKIEDFL